MHFLRQELKIMYSAAIRRILSSQTEFIYKNVIVTYVMNTYLLFYMKRTLAFLSRTVDKTFCKAQIFFLHFSSYGNKVCQKCIKC